MKEINFLGQQVTVPYLSGRRLTRIAASLYHIQQQINEKANTVVSDALQEAHRTGDAIKLIQMADYRKLIKDVFERLVTNLDSAQELTPVEKMFYGVLGEMVGGFSAEEVADAPFDDLYGLVETILEQERDTRLGKLLMSIFKTDEEEDTKTTDEQRSTESSPVSTKTSSKRKP